MSLAIALDLPNQTLNLSRGLTNSSSARYARSLLAGFNNTPEGLSTGDLDSWYYNQGACFKDALSGSFSRLSSSYSSRHLRLARALAFVKGVGSWQLGTDFDQQQLNLATAIQSFFFVTEVYRLQAELFNASQDTTVGNNGGFTGSWTSVNPDTDVQEQTPGGIVNVGWTAVGEWLQWDRPAPMTNGNYSLSMNFSKGDNAACSGDVNGVGFSTPGSGNWATFTTATNLATIPVSGATTTFRLTFSSSYNLDWIELTKVN